MLSFFNKYTYYIHLNFTYDRLLLVGMQLALVDIAYKPMY